MKTSFELYAKSREMVGKGASRRLRKQSDLIPAIVYGSQKPANNIMLEHKEILKALKNKAFYSHILTLHVDGHAEKVVLKALQRHPVKPIIMHMDFLRISGDQKIHMTIPIHFINEENAPGLEAGGIVSHTVKELEVSCLPADLPEYIEIDLGHLALNESVHLSQLKAPHGVEFLALSHGDDATIAAIHLPRVVEEEVVEEVTSEETSEETEGGREAETDEPQATEE